MSAGHPSDASCATACGQPRAQRAPVHSRAMHPNMQQARTRTHAHTLFAAHGRTSSAADRSKISRGTRSEREVGAPSV
eukprot:15462607-Alexandrium_andersonii.AAC.1